MSVLASPLARAFDGPHDRDAEASLADWLSMPVLDALESDLARMAPATVRQLGATLEAILLLGVTPPSTALKSAIQLAADLAHPSADADSPVQRRWGVARLAFDPARLRQRLQERAPR